MTLVEKIRLLQNRKHFEKLVDEKHEKIIKKNKRMIFLYIVWILLHFILVLSFPLSIFDAVYFVFSLLILGETAVVLNELNDDEYLNRKLLMIEEKKCGYKFFKCFFFNENNYFLLVSLFLIYFIMGLFREGLGAYFITHGFFLIISLFIFSLNVFFSKSIHCHFIDEEINDLIEIEQIKIYNEHFNDFGLKYKANDKINFMNQVLKKLSDELNNEKLLKELNLLDKFKESNLDLVLKEYAELNNIALSVSLLNELDCKKESLLNGLIQQNSTKKLNKKFDKLLKKYQNFIDSNQKYFHEGELNPLSFKVKFDKLIETENSIIEKLENPVELPDDSEIWLIQIENEINLLNAEKKNIIQELKLKKQQSEQYVKDILIKEVS